MKILGIDGSGLVASVAVVEDDNLIGEYTTGYKKTHSQTLLPMLDELSKMIELDLNQIDAIAVAAGPGSFTGIRIGMGIAKVLASLNNIKLKAISSLNAFSNPGKHMVILDAKANRVYLGIYNDNVNVIDETVVEIDTFKEMMKKYPDYDVLLDSDLINLKSPTIDVIENMNRIAQNVEPIANVDTLVPIYLKER